MRGYTCYNFSRKYRKVYVAEKAQRVKSTVINYLQVIVNNADGCTEKEKEDKHVMSSLLRNENEYD